jgi:hypothetical protein
MFESLRNFSQDIALGDPRRQMAMDFSPVIDENVGLPWFD